MSKNILIVDDEKDIVLVLRLALEKAGYNVFEAYNGIEALKIADEKGPDLIVLDIMMPQLDGHTVNIRLKENPKTAKIPVIIITGRGNFKELIEVRNDLKIFEYLEKPFAVSVLIDKIKEIVPV
ncbi:MAG: response regulator [Endomicrobiales bacterium]|nr:response regulator [Endomicrobiales bacterium]